VGRVVGVKEAHQQFTKLIREVEAGQQIVITREGHPVAVLLNTDEYNSTMATLEEMADPEALRALREAGADSRAGRVYTYEDVFGHPPIRERRRRKRES